MFARREVGDNSRRARVQLAGDEAACRRQSALLDHPRLRAEVTRFERLERTRQQAGQEEPAMTVAYRRREVSR